MFFGLIKAKTEKDEGRDGQTAAKAAAPILSKGVQQQQQQQRQPGPSDANAARHGSSVEQNHRRQPPPLLPLPQSLTRTKAGQFEAGFRASLRDTSDLLAPNYLEVREHYARVGDTYYIYTCIPNLPRRLRAGWLDPLKKANLPHDVDLFLQPLETRQAIDSLMRRQRDLTATKRQNNQKGQLNTPELELALDDIPSFIGKLEAGKDRVMTMGIVITTWASSLEKARDQAIQLSAIATRCGADVRRLVLKQEKGLRCNLPDGEFHLALRQDSRWNFGGFYLPFRLSRSQYGRWGAVGS